MPRGRVQGSLDPRVWFWPHVDVGAEDECWLWTASTFPKGYGKVYDRRIKKYVGTHRVVLSLFLGVSLNELKQANHTCDVYRCCNPFHLYNGTQLDNQRDMSARGRSAGQKKLACPKGHDYSEENTKIVRRSNGKVSRICRLCHRNQHKNWLEKNPNYRRDYYRKQKEL